MGPGSGGPGAPRAPGEAGGYGPNEPGIPGAGSPLNPLSPGAGEPGTPGPGAPPDYTGWRNWWNLNGDAYLDTAALLAGRAKVSGQTAGAGLTDEVVDARLVPLVEKLLRKGGDVAFLRNALVARARMGAGSSRSVGVDFFARHHLKSEYPELCEASILALGISGSESAIPTLVHLLLNDEEGQRMVGGPLAVRSRAFAAYSLGALGLRSNDQTLRLKVVHALFDALADERTATREIQVASVLAAGQVELEFCGDDPEKLERHRMEGDKHLCGGVQLRYLLDVFRDLDQDPWVRAHVASSMGRLGRNAPLEFKQAVVEELGTAIDPKGDELPAVQHAAAIGLGLVADSDSDELDVEARERLNRALKKGDPLTQRFALIGLAQAASRPGDGENDGKALSKVRSSLLREVSRSKGDKQAWAALSLGVFAHGRMANLQPVSKEVSKALRSTLKRASDPGVASAAALGLAILRDTEAAKDLNKALRKRGELEFRADASLAIGLCADPESLEDVATSFDLETVAIEELERIALGLSLLGDRNVVPAVQSRLEACEDDDERAALTGLLGRLEDKRALSTLLALAEDETQDSAVRAEAVKAIGELCDPIPESWTGAYAKDLQYELATWTLTSPFEDGTGLLDQR